MRKIQNQKKAIISLVILLVLSSCEITRKPIKSKSSSPIGHQSFDPKYIFDSNKTTPQTTNIPPVALPTTPNNVITPPSVSNQPRDLITEIPPTGIETANGEFQTHTVRKNESFWSIAKRYKINYRDLMTANGANAKTILRIGMKLVIPNNSGNAVRQIQRVGGSPKGYKKTYAPLPKNGIYIVQKMTTFG